MDTSDGTKATSDTKGRVCDLCKAGNHVECRDESCACPYNEKTIDEVDAMDSTKATNGDAWGSREIAKHVLEVAECSDCVAPANFYDAEAMLRLAAQRLEEQDDEIERLRAARKDDGELIKSLRHRLRSGLPYGDPHACPTSCNTSFCGRGGCRFTNG